MAVGNSIWRAVPAGLFGALLGIYSQIHYLATSQWEAPALRLVGGAVAGLLLALLILWCGQWALTRWADDARRSVFALRVAFAAQMVIFVLCWGLMAASPWGAAVAAAGLAAVVCLATLWARRQLPTPSPALTARVGLALCLLLALALRLAGLSHGLPDYIPHCDTPKQFLWLEGILKGNLIAPSSYPIGHLYLYAAVMKLLSLLLHVDFANIYAFGADGVCVISARTYQVLLGTALCGVAFLIGRRLWGLWAGLATALLLAMDPVHMTYSRQIMGEVPQTFWVLLSLLCSVRVFQGGGRGDYFLAGVFAGLAVATKIYGGYIMVSLLAGHFLSRRREGLGLGSLALALVGLALGLLALTPTLLLDPQRWFSFLVGESASQYKIGFPLLDGFGMALGSPWTGFPYLWNAMLRRFHLLWLIWAAAGVLFLMVRRKREDLFILIPFGVSVAIILTLRLSYLREWDFVNLTPYLAMAIAATLPPLWGLARRKRALRLAVAGGLAAFLGFQLLIAVGDAWIARFPDSRYFARFWIDRQDIAPESIIAQTRASNYFAQWLPNGAVGSRDVLGQHAADAPEMRDKKAMVYEKFWWAPTPDGKAAAPTVILGVRNYYWEHPEIYIYDLDAPRFESMLILPHTRAIVPEPVTLNTAWAKSRPMDLVLDRRFVSLDAEMGQRRFVAAQEPLGEVGFLCLGQGNGSLRFGPGVGRAFKAEPGRVVEGIVTPLRAIVPRWPRNYQFGLEPEGEPTALWVGLYPQPRGMLPLLARYDQWRALERIAGRDGGDGPGAAEARLFHAAALAEAGDVAGAAKALKALDKDRPGFLNDYGRLAQARGEEFWRLMTKMTTASRAMLLAERARWSLDPEANRRAPGQAWSGAAHMFNENTAHVWLPWEYLPGFVEARVTWRRQAGHAGSKGLLRLIAHTDDYFSRVLASQEVDAATSEGLLRAELPHGPLKLEVALTYEDDAGPIMESVAITPDLPAEFRWRWGVLASRLHQLVAEGSPKIPVEVAEDE